jgi:hypothetical protein
MHVLVRADSHQTTSTTWLRSLEAHFQVTCYITVNHWSLLRYSVITASILLMSLYRSTAWCFYKELQDGVSMGSYRISSINTTTGWCRYTELQDGVSIQNYRMVYLYTTIVCCLFTELHDGVSIERYRMMVL